MFRKSSVVGGFIVFALAVVLAFSAEAVSVFSSINLTGALAAFFVAVVGFAWFVKKTLSRSPTLNLSSQPDGDIRAIDKKAPIKYVLTNLP